MKVAPLAESGWEAIDLWKDYRPTALIELPALAERTGVGRVFVKNEGQRPLGNFKVLGGMVAGLRALARAAGVTSIRDLDSRRSNGHSLPRLVCASEGNHGLAVAAAAQRGGAGATIYLPVGVNRSRARRIEALGAQVVWISGTYDDAVRAAAAMAIREQNLLIADTSSDSRDAVASDVMAGYALLTRELVAQFRDEVAGSPSHLFVQAGVGGLAAAMAEGLMKIMQAPRGLLVVEPRSAACVAQALATGVPSLVPGDLRTAAEMLACGLASAPALELLQRHRARSVIVDEDQLHAAVELLRDMGGVRTTPSGAAGLAGLLQVSADPGLRLAHGLDVDSNVLLVATEAASDDA